MLFAVPAAWNEVNNACGGNRQSPINIVTKKTKQDSRLTAFKFTGYTEVFTSMLKNNGQTGNPGPFCTLYSNKNRNGKYGKQVGTLLIDRCVGTLERVA